MNKSIAAKKKSMKCLRCKTIELIESPRGGQPFYICPECQREFMLNKHGRLHERWLSPLSLVLYAALYPPLSDEKVIRIAENLVEPNIDGKKRTPEEINYIITEIRLELDHPTQRLQDILPGLDEHPEEDLREFVRKVADELERLCNLERE